jgi:hypothetical protein
MMLSKQKPHSQAIRESNFIEQVTCAGGVTRQALSPPLRQRDGSIFGVIHHQVNASVPASFSISHFARWKSTLRSQIPFAKLLLARRRRCGAKSCPQGRVHIHLRDDPHRRYISHYVLTRARARVCVCVCVGRGEEKRLALLSRSYLHCETYMKANDAFRISIMYVQSAQRKPKHRTPRDESCRGIISMYTCSESKTTVDSGISSIVEEDILLY